MAMQNLMKQIILNKEKIIAYLCFWCLLCFNLLLLISSIYRMFTFDGDIVNIKEYIENNYDLTEKDKKILKYNTFRGWEIVQSTYRLCLMNLFVFLTPFFLVPFGLKN